MSRKDQPLPHRDDRIWRAVEEHRARALKRLDGTAERVKGELFPPHLVGNGDFLTELGRTVARDLTALGLPVRGSGSADSIAGVWLAPAPDASGIIATWAQHEASAPALGLSMHHELQLLMNSALYQILRFLGYPVDGYGGGGSQVVTGFRPPLPGPHMATG